MRCVFQLIRSDNGKRSPPGAFPREEYAQLLRNWVKDDTISTQDFVLVLLEDREDEWHASFAPIMRVDTFINHFGESTK